MNPRRWQEVKEILDDASRLAPEARPDFLDQSCGDDPALREEVASLLAFHDQRHEILDRPAFDVNAEDPFVGRRLGRYRIVRPLGRGGMGVVYLATRESDYSRQVAIKLIQRGIDTEERIARFHEERQILADLDHPSIARLFDGGTTEEGLPYLVMELVEGEPIDRYCDIRRLGVLDRLALFRQVLAAVCVSHQHLVVHRDLKPGNILVTADGTPKLIDFGIAKLLHAAEAAGAPAAAPQRQRLMSPRYASPEQVRGERITTASDIYALGVLLYELSSGRPPYRVDTTAEDDLVRVICETDPVPPSAAVRRADPADRSTIARSRGTTARRLRRELEDELDAIVLKAMRKEPRQRYASIEQFSEDVERYLSGLPIRARASTLPYRFGKFVRRHRLGLMAAGLALAVAGFISATAVLRSQAVHERQRAEAVAAFVEDLFRAAGPDRADGESLSVRELLDRGRGHIGTGLEDQPLVRAALLEVVGRVYKSLGDWDPAERLLVEALDLQRRHDPGDDATMARRVNELAALLHEKGDLDRAEPLYREALERIGGCRSAESDALRIAGNLAWLRTQKGDFAEAETLVNCLRDRRYHDPDSGDPVVASVLNRLGALRYSQQRFEEAEALFREALAIRQDYHGLLHTRVANALNNLGKVLHARGKDLEAERILRQALRVRTQLLHPGHPRIANTEKNLAQVLTALGKAEAAEPMARHAVEILRSKMSADPWIVADAESVLGGCLAALGRCREAEALLVTSYPIIERKKGEESPDAHAARRRRALLDEHCRR